MYYDTYIRCYYRWQMIRGIVIEIIDRQFYTYDWITINMLKRITEIDLTAVLNVYENETNSFPISYGINWHRDDILNPQLSRRHRI